MITIDWLTKIITIPTSFLTLVSGTPGTGDLQVNPALYELNVNALRLALKDIEDSDGMPFLDTHRHNTEVVLSGVTYARSFEIINGYKIEFDTSVYDHYSVRCVGANHNIADVRVANTASLIVGNSAGLISTTINSGSGLDGNQSSMLEEIYQRLGLALGKPLVQTQTQISTPDFELTITEAPGQVTVTRQ